MDQCL
jgi:hypothetical protein